MAPSFSIPFNSTSSTAEQAQLRDGLLTASLPLTVSSSSSSSPTLASSATASADVAAEAIVAAASAAAFAKATVSWPEAVEGLTGVGEGAVAAADGSEAAAAAVEGAPPIGGVEPAAAASATEKLGALDSMEGKEEMKEFALGRGDEIWRRDGARVANGEGIGRAHV